MKASVDVMGSFPFFKLCCICVALDVVLFERLRDFHMIVTLGYFIIVDIVMNPAFLGSRLFTSEMPHLLHKMCHTYRWGQK